MISMEMFLLRLIENLCDYLKGYQPPITCSKFTKETQEQGVKYV